MKRTVLFAAALAFVLGMGFTTSPSVVFAADKKENPCAKLTDKKEKAACMKKEADAKKAKK